MFVWKHSVTLYGCFWLLQVCEYEAAGGAPDMEDAPKVTDYPEKVRQDAQGA